ncbi:hypothetical protein WMY93_028050 [Mugilogobius chulae]|uniref:Diacylglycerol kinase type I N-terminal domain-containing protein n=1 Tax=Mugilogobius chulae TaxID=88201 RepID=A0AAW0N0F8_9GOBI
MLYSPGHRKADSGLDPDQSTAPSGPHSPPAKHSLKGWRITLSTLDPLTPCTTAWVWTEVSGHFASGTPLIFFTCAAQKPTATEQIPSFSGSMSSPAADSEVKELSPVDFIQLQQYIEYCSLKVKDVLREFDPDGSLARHRHGECINEEGFRLFLKTYLEVEDFPVDLCQRLFRSFQNSKDSTDSAKEVFLKDVSCYFLFLRMDNPETNWNSRLSCTTETETESWTALRWTGSLLR